MKILQIITSLRTGGAEKLLLDLYPRFKTMGHEMDIMVFDKTDSPLMRQAGEAGIRVIESLEGYYQMWNPTHIWRIDKLLNGGGYDIVHTHNTPAQLFTSLVSKRGDTKFITTEHNTDNRRRGWRWYRKADILMYGKYDRIICVSESTRRNLEERIGENRGRMTVVTNGIDLARFKNDTAGDKVASTPEKRDGEKVILMAAAFRSQKDHPTLIRAMRSLPANYVLWLAGDGQLLDGSKNIVTTLGLDDRVKFLGVREDMPQLMKKADIGVLSTHYEGFGISAVESMASGLPLVATDVDGLSEIVADAGVLVPHSDEAALAREILKIGENPLYAAQLAEAGRIRSEKFDIDNTAREYMKIYLETLT